MLQKFASLPSTSCFQTFLTAALFSRNSSLPFISVPHVPEVLAYPIRSFPCLLMPFCIFIYHKRTFQSESLPVKPGTTPEFIWNVIPMIYAFLCPAVPPFYILKALAVPQPYFTIFLFCSPVPASGHSGPYFFFLHCCTRRLDR